MPLHLAHENCLPPDRAADYSQSVPSPLTLPACQPVFLYLDNLAPSGRRSMRSALQSATGTLGFTGPLEQFPWPQLQYPHVAQVRHALKQQGKAITTVNLTLSVIPPF